MKINLQLCSIIVFSLVACSLISPSLNAQDKVVKKEIIIQQGSKLKARFNRSTLRKYAKKIEQGNISKDEMVEYIVKGGSLKEFKHYDSVNSFFVGDPQYPIINFFLKKRFDDGSEPPENRLELLAVALTAGANPNFHVASPDINKNSNLAPVLQACAADDIEALELLIQYGGNLELREEVYTGTQGPCLAATESINMLNWLLLHGANIRFKDEYGKTLLHLAVESHASLEKIRWLIDKGVSLQTKDQYGDQAIDRVRDLIYVRELKIQSYKDNTLDSSEAQERLQLAIKSEMEVIAYLQKLADILLSK